MTRVLHLSHTDIEFDSRIMKEITCLAAAGYDVGGIGIFAREGACRSSVGPSSKIRALNIRSKSWKWLPSVLRNAIALAEMQLRMLIHGLRFRPNVIHSHDFLALPVGLIIKIVTHSQLVYDAHELESDRNGIGRLESGIVRRAEKLSWGLIDGLIVVSGSIGEWYRCEFGSKPTAIVLNAPLISPGLAVNSNYLREKFKIPAGKLVFIYIGYFALGRGIEQTLEVFKRADVQAHVVFLGYGPLLETIQVSESNFPNIHWHQAVPHEEVTSIAQSADVGLCLVEPISLSDYLSLPNKLFEYAFSELRILASDLPEVRSVLDEYKLGETSELTLEGLSLSIKRLQACTIRRENIDLNPLSWEAQALTLLDFYSTIINVRRQSNANL